MTNACVSHEMRNPLNAISALNKVKIKLYKKVIKILDEGQNINQLRGIMKELSKGMKVQDDSVSLLNFLVQNMLDYAQIRAGKLRKNIERFSI